MDSTQPEPLRTSQPAMSRAEQFEDEKKRIVTSCFSKKGSGGQLLQSYITHIRVEEDAAYQSSPPPPDSPPENKKSRIIVVGVKNTGRVLMHKARENEDFTFQIGKTWPMEELKSIESFSSLSSRTKDQQERAEWAGPTGFMITMLKPYYWKAKTSKEKDFFIGSLVKIYRKYTSGKVPQLIGFSQKEQDDILGASIPQSIGHTAGPTTIVPPAATMQDSSHQSNTPDRPLTARGRGASPSEPKRASSPLRYRDPVITKEQIARQQRPLTSTRDDSYYATQQPQSPGSSLNTRVSQDSSVLHRSSREQLYPTHLQPSSASSSQTLTPQPSPSGLRFNDGVNAGMPFPSTNNVTSPTGNAPSTTDQVRAANRYTVEPFPLSASTTERWRPNGIVPKVDRDNSPDVPELRTTDALNEHVNGQSPSVLNRITQAVPERRRPPLQDAALRGSRNRRAPSDSDVPRPLAFRTAPPEGMAGTSNKERRNATTPPLLELQKTNMSTSSRGMSPTSSSKSHQEQSDISSSLQRAEGTGIQLPSIVDASTSQTHDKTQEPLLKAVEIVDEHYRPGLGPMMVKRPNTDTSSRVRKAANAYSAFKPRAGGAGERLLGSKAKPPMEADGVTKVFPTQSNGASMSKGDFQAPETSTVTEGLVNKPIPPHSAGEMSQAEDLSHKDEAFSHNSAQEYSEQGNNSDELTTQRVSEEQPDIMPASNDLASLTPAKRAPSKPLSHKYAKCFNYIDVDPSTMQGREREFEDILSEFGWRDNALQAHSIATLEADIRREIARLETRSWLGHRDQKDEHVETVVKLLDKAIAECDEMEGLLTIYGVELSTLNEDIAYVEAQSQGLQVQTANQKLLHTELHNLVETISVSSSQLLPLQKASLGDPAGVALIESSLMLLYRALHTIDPSCLKGKSQTQASSSSHNQSLGTMRALRERKDLYLNDTYAFLQRMRNYMDPAFGAALLKTADTIKTKKNSARGSLALDPANHDAARQALWQYSPIILFVKEVDMNFWEEIIGIYRARVRTTYQDELQASFSEWKKTARKPTNDEIDALFTSQEKENESLTGTARKLTVKRSQALANTLRTSSDKKRPMIDKNQGARLYPFETFAGAVAEMVPLISTEQNFIVDFFHATSLVNIDFPDSVNTALPQNRHGTDLFAKRLVEPDRTMARIVNDAVNDVFSAWPHEMQSLVEWATNSHPLQGVGVLFTLERARIEFEESNQEFIVHTLQKVHERLSSLFTSFVDDQIRAIEETKVKIHKRKGVIAFIKIFPNFSAMVENMLPPASGPQDSETRAMVDVAYTRINKAMFDSLKVIAKADPAIVSTQGHGHMLGQGADPEDKEALNYHILLIENMYHYYTEVEERGDAILGEWLGRAMLEMSEHQELYVGAVIRRPLGKLIDFLESTDNILSSSASPDAPASITTTHASHSRSVFKKLLGIYDTKEVRRGIETLRKRIEKHFGEADDRIISQKLIAMIEAECERKYHGVLERTQRIAANVYEGAVEVEFGTADISQAFRR